MSEVGGGDATSSMRGFRVELMEEGDVVLRGAFAAGKSVLSSSSLLSLSSRISIFGLKDPCPKG